MEAEGGGVAAEESDQADGSGEHIINLAFESIIRGINDAINIEPVITCQNQKASEIIGVNDKTIMESNPSIVKVHNEEEIGINDSVGTISAFNHVTNAQNLMGIASNVSGESESSGTTGCGKAVKGRGKGKVTKKQIQLI